MINLLSDSTLNYIHKINKDVRITIISSGNSDTMKNARIVAEEYRRAKHTRVHLDDVDPLRDIDQAEQIKVATGIALRGTGVLVAANEHGRFIPEEELAIRGMTGGQETPQRGFSRRRRHHLSHPRFAWKAKRGRFTRW